MLRTGGLGAFENVFSFTPGSAGQTGTVTVVLSSATDQGFYVRPLCNDPLSELTCIDAELGGTDETSTFPVNGGDPLSIFVDGFFSQAEAGPFTLSATFTPAISPGPAPQLGPRALRVSPWSSFLHAR